MLQTQWFSITFGLVKNKIVLTCLVKSSKSLVVACKTFANGYCQRYGIYTLYVRQKLNLKFSELSYHS